jgi:hypothetical protein
MNGELSEICEDAIVAYFNYALFPETEKNTKPCFFLFGF